MHYITFLARCCGPRIGTVIIILFWTRNIFYEHKQQKHEESDKPTDKHEKVICISEHQSSCSPSWSCLWVRKPPLKLFAASCTHFWRSAHGTIRWIINLLRSAQQLSPHTAHYHADFFPLATVDTVNGWLSQIITSAFHTGVQSDLCGSELHVLLRVPHRLDCSCDRLSCSAASGSERAIITACPRAGSVFGPARITWSSLCNSLSLSEVFWGHINNSRLPWLSHVSTNESSHQKSKVGQLSLSFFPRPPLCHAAADQFFTNSSPIRPIVMRTSCFLAEEPW